MLGLEQNSHGPTNSVLSMALYRMQGTWARRQGPAVSRGIAPSGPLKAQAGLFSPERKMTSVAEAGEKREPSHIDGRNVKMVPSTATPP